MAVTEQSRHEMVEALIERLGREVAMTLVEHLPPAGWHQVATRADVDAVRIGLRSEMAELGGELRSEMAELRGELRSEMAELRGEMAELRGDLRAEMAALGGDLRSELHRELGGLHDRLGDVQRTLVLGFVGALTANTAVILTALRLFGGT